MTQTPFTPDELRLLDEAEAALARSLHEVETSPALLARVRNDLESPRSWTPWAGVPSWRVVLVSASVAILAFVAAAVVPVRRPAAAVSSLSPSASSPATPTLLEADAVVPASSTAPGLSVAGALPVAPASAAPPASPAIASSSPLGAPKPSLPGTPPVVAHPFEVLVPKARAAEQEAALWQLAALAADGGAPPRALAETGEPMPELGEPALSEIVPVFFLDSRSDS